MKILIIEDNPNLAQALARAMKKQKFSVEVCQDGKQWYDMWMQSRNDISLVLLDEMLPSMSGLEIMRNIRENSIATPVIMLTAKSDLGDVVLGLNTGCDDYVAKPFELEELLARINVLLRRKPRLHTGIVSITHELTLFLEARKLEKSWQEIHLTSKEFQILELLVRNNGNALSEQKIFDECFDFAKDYTSNTIEVHVKNLRKKLFHNDMYDVLKTIRWHGYRLDIQGV
jgi:two-component system, OmpR family, copper resistance phosphate regulon response regulator CusR